jgi:hypothetical protein
LHDYRLLHEHRIDRTAIVSGLIGIAAGLLAVLGVSLLLSLVAGAAGRASGGEAAVPVAALTVISSMVLALIIALVADSVRDLLLARRLHPRLDVVRLVATAVIAVFGAVVITLQAMDLARAVGDAAIFALGAAAVGSVTALVMLARDARAYERAGAHATGPDAG